MSTGIVTIRAKVKRAPSVRFFSSKKRLAAFNAIKKETGKTGGRASKS